MTTNRFTNVKFERNGKILCKKLNHSQCKINFHDREYMAEIYDVIDTDYESYSIISGHMKGYVKLFNTEETFVYTRKPLQPDSMDFLEMDEKVKGIIAEKIPGCKYSNLLSIYHGDECVYET